MHSSFSYAGGQRNMVTFCKYLNKNIFNVFAAAYIEGGLQEKRLESLGIDFVTSKGSAEKIIDFIKNKSIDIIHIHRSGGYVPLETEIIKEAKKINNQIIVIEKNVFGMYDPTLFRDIDCSLFQSMMHLNERFLPASGLKFDPKKMKVFYNMIDQNDFEKYRLSKEQTENYKKELNINKDDFVIGKIARPHIAKWSDLILDMMPYLVKLVPNLKFIIVGVPRSRIKKIEKSKLKRYFVLLNETSNEAEIHKFYQTIDVLAHSSKIGECNGNTINEAMFWKKPVVVNSTPKKDNGQIEQVIHMHNGLIANHPQTFAQALAYLYKNPAKQEELGENGRSIILREHNPKLVTQMLEKVFIESLFNNGFNIDKSVVGFYDNVTYKPDQKDILDYKEKYKKILKIEFGQLEIKDKIINFLNLPKRFYFKIKDFIEHRFGF